MPAAVRSLRYHAEGWGVGELWLRRGRPVWHELPSPRPGSRPLTTDHPVVGRLQRYFGGRPVDLDDIQLDLGELTPFQRRLAAELRAVPRGQVVTYGELAALAGRPGAARAAGTFCARNPIPIFIPCHRVVAAGGLGSYGSLGAGYKRRLLELEGAV